MMLNIYFNYVNHEVHEIQEKLCHSILQVMKNTPEDANHAVNELEILE